MTCTISITFFLTHCTIFFTTVAIYTPAGLYTTAVMSSSLFHGTAAPGRLKDEVESLGSANPPQVRVHRVPSEGESHEKTLSKWWW